jgi:anaerobic magnesium-protoporphyrin IX monomethyl ester cyclase
MKILFINPRYYEEDYRYKVNKLSPPLGMALLASMLRRSNHVVKILDLEAEKTPLTGQIGFISEFAPHVIGVFGTSPIHKYIKECITLVRRQFPEAIIIIGGPHATLFPTSFFDDGFNVDYVFRGEAEYSIVEFTNQLSLYKAVRFPDKIEGIVYKQNGTLYIHPVTPKTTDLDSLPFPSYDLLPLERYYETGSDGKAITMMTSRGCPQSCIYCADPVLYGHKFRSRSAKSIVEEMKLLNENYDVTHIVFYDANFNASKKRVKEICKALIDAKLAVTWRARVRADNLDRECVKLMKAAGCSELSLGVESGSQRVLEILKKKTTKDKIRSAFNLIREYGLWSSGYFMFGVPGETKADAEETIQFAIELDPDWALFSTATPLPGTEFLNIVKASKNLLSCDLSDYKFNFDTSVVSYEEPVPEICTGR